MTKTIKELHTEAAGSDEATDAYFDARSAKADAIVEYLEGKLRDDVDLRAAAEEIMSRAEETGRFEDDTVHGEVRGLYTRDGNPLTVSI